MDQVKYQGYARGQGFSPIQLSTASVDAIAQQGNNLLRQMQDNRETERRNRDAFQSGMENAQQQERQNRASNFNFESQYRDYYQGAALQNARTRVENATNTQRNQLKRTELDFSALATLSGTIAKMVQDDRKKKDEIAELQASNLIFETQVSFEEFQALKAGEDKLDQSNTQVNNVVNKLKAAGYGEEYLAKLRNLSGAGLYGAMKQWAIQGGENYGAFRAEMADKPYEVDGQQITLQQAAKGSPEVYNTVNMLIRSDYLKQYRGLNQAFADKYLYSGMRQVEARERLLFSENRAKELELDLTQKESNSLLTEWQSAKNQGNGGAGVLKWIQVQAGGDSKELGEKRRTALKYLVAAAKAGKFTGEDLTQLEGTEFFLNGSATPTTIGKQFDTDLPELRSAVREFNAAKRAEREQAEEDEKKQAEQELSVLFSKGAPNKAEVRQITDAWRAKGWGDPPAWIKGIETAEQLSDEAGDAVLLNLKVNGMLSLKELRSGRYSDKLQEKYMPAVEKQQQVPEADKKLALDAVYAELKTSLNSIGAGTNQNPDYFIAAGEAKRLVTSRASELMDQAVEPRLAWNQARDEIKQLIKLGRQEKPEGPFKLRTQPDGSPDFNNRGFVLGSSVSSNRAQQERIKKIQARLDQTGNTDFLSRPGANLLTLPEVERLKGFRNGTGSLPPIVWALSAKVPDASPFDIANLLMKGNGQDPIQRPPAAAIYDGVRPELMQLLNRKPSMDRALRAMEGSGNAYKPILDLIASKESSNDTQFGGYDSMNLGEGRPDTGSQRFGRPLTQMKVSEILSLGANNGIYAAGRYQFIPGTLRGLVNRGVVSPNDTFNQQTQDKLAVTYLRDRTGKFWAGQASAASYVSGLGNAWHGLRSIPPQRIIQAMESAKSSLAGSDIDVSRMRPQVVYRVGGIGPKGPDHFGPHLDIKQSNEGFFERNALDRYLSFKTANGLVPISRGVTVKGGEFGAQRWYGSHNGWDYAIDAGTPVVLKGGARVISKRPSEYGDVLTIGLPDGRRFNIIHGKAT
jgi:muramidase (phage lysozyme)